LNHTSYDPLCECVGDTGCSEELTVLTQSLLSVNWLNHIKYCPLRVYVCLNHIGCDPLCVGGTGCSEELIVLTQSLLSVAWLNHIKYGPLCCLVPHVGASVCLRLCPSLPRDILTAFTQHSITAPVCHFSMLSLIICLSGCLSFSVRLC